MSLIVLDRNEQVTDLSKVLNPGRGIAGVGWGLCLAAELWDFVTTTRVRRSERDPWAQLRRGSEEVESKAFGKSRE